jgi:hypothetical protein
MPKTELHEMALKCGTLTAKTWNDYDYTGRPIFQSLDLDGATLIRLRKKAIFSFYFSLSFLLNQTLSIRSFYDVKKKWRGFFMLLKVIFKL